MPASVRSMEELCLYSPEVSNIELLPNSMLSLQTEEEAWGEVLDILHTVMMISTKIVLQVSCHDDGRYHILSELELSLWEEGMYELLFNPEKASGN